MAAFPAKPILGVTTSWQELAKLSALSQITILLLNCSLFKGKLQKCMFIKDSMTIVPASCALIRPVIAALCKTLTSMCKNDIPSRPVMRMIEFHAFLFFVFDDGIKHPYNKLGFLQTPSVKISRFAAQNPFNPLIRGKKHHHGLKD
ncbi:MAG: hypothetical protein NTX50_24070 [Candidatus Sumerlaeota bacterium]|nr:hypothetical protein [Candidatus Sumerlaeota bacterium]